MHKATMTTQWFLQFTHRKHLKLKLNVKHSIDILYLPESRLDDYLALICKLILQSYMWKKRKGVLINDIDPVNVLQLNIVNPWKSMILYQNYWVWQQKHYTHCLSVGLWIHLYYDIKSIYSARKLFKEPYRAGFKDEYSNSGARHCNRLLWFPFSHKGFHLKYVKWKVDFSQQHCVANATFMIIFAH